jgi:hypothetical protein
VSIRHHLPFYKNIRDRKNLNYHFLFLKKMAAKIRRSYQKLTNAGSFSALLSQVRGGLDTTCLSFFVIANFCFYKKKYCSYKNSSMIFTLHRHFSGGERVFFQVQINMKKLFLRETQRWPWCDMPPPPTKKGMGWRPQKKKKPGGALISARIVFFV